MASQTYYEQSRENPNLPYGYDNFQSGNNTYQPQQEQHSQYQQPQYQQQPQPQYEQQQHQQYQSAPPPPQQPQYPQGPPQYDQNKPPPPQQQNYDGKQTFDQAFKLDKPKYNDLWAAILFVIVFLGFTAVSGLSLHGYASISHGGIYGNTNNAITLNSNTIILFAFVLAVALALSWGYLLAARAFTKQFIWITGILNILVGVGTAIYYFYRHYWSAGIVFALFAVFSIFCFITWIPRIPFSVLMLQTTIDVARKHGHVFLTSLIGGIVALAFSAWFSVTLVAVYVKYHPQGAGCSAGGGSCSNAKVIGIIVFITFAGYWISEVIKNVIHSTIAGVYGSWFFCAGKPGGMPKGATRGAFKRSMTYSFGSISFGSLIVAIINLIRQACSVAQQQEASQGNAAAACAFCILGCIISLIDWLVQFINRYAFSHIALYGKPYIAAAKDTWQMMRNRGIDALVNDCLIGPVLSMGAVFVGFVCALLAFLYLEFTNPSYNDGRAYTAVIVAFSFLIGLQVCHIIMTPLSSGVDTFFVAASWDPEVLMRDHPDIYQRMIQVYPKVQQAIHA